MIHYLLRRPVAVTMFYMAVVILGYFSFRNLAIEGQPDTELPQLIVNTGWGTTSPEVVQVFLTSPIEESSAQIEGLEEMISSSTRGQSEVTLKFNRETDMDFAKLDLNERLSKLRSELPPGASQPRILMAESSRRVDEDFMAFAISGPYNLDELTELFDDYLRNEISSVDGVADVTVRGEREKAVKIRLDREAMDLYGLVPQVVLGRVNQFTTNTKPTARLISTANIPLSLRTPFPASANWKIRCLSGIAISWSAFAMWVTSSSGTPRS